LAKSDLQLSKLLRRMVMSSVRNIIIVLGILIALSQIGIRLGPLLAGLGVVGFVIGFALQDTLSNFASGMMILIYRPFDVGDLIEAAGVSGKVNKMSLVNTTVLTLDNQTILIPNNKIWSDVVKNVTGQTMRRIDLMFGVSYSDDIPKTERVLQEILDSHDKVLAEPEPIVRLHELADSSVNFVVRPWVDTDDYWEVYWDITRSVKIRFDEEGISIPFPQRDVHIDNPNSL
jgi:small conductance mechanosensitive channel